MSWRAAARSAASAPTKPRFSFGDARLQIAVFLAIAVLCAGFGFVGLTASSLWVDELFTLFVIDHGGGIAEVWRRALTDTHPPAYYVIAYYWLHLFGNSTAVFRLLSTLLAVAAAAVTFFGLRPVASLPARAFAAAVATGSSFWFEYSQNGRSYTLAALVSAILLSLSIQAHQADRAGKPVPAIVSLGLVLTGALGCFTHFYSFLTVGAVYLYLLLTVRQTRFRLLIVVTGLVLFVLVAAYTRLLLGATTQDIQNMWFTNEPFDLLRQAVSGIGKTISGLTIPALIVLALRARRRTQAKDLWLPRMTGVVCLVVLATGVAISLIVAPSFGKRNVLLLAPFMWALAAWLYDAGGPVGTTRGVGLLGLSLLITASWGLLILPERALPRYEEWRGSAAYVASFPACRGQEIPVVQPYIFGPSTPFFRHLAERYFFGRYAAEPQRLRSYLPQELMGNRTLPRFRALVAERARPGACPVLLWAVHDVTAQQAHEFAQELAADPGLAGRAVVRTKTFYFYKPQWLGRAKLKAAAWVYTAEPLTTASAQQSVQGLAIRTSSVAKADAP